MFIYHVIKAYNIIVHFRVRNSMLSLNNVDIMLLFFYMGTAEILVCQITTVRDSVDQFKFQ